MKKNGFLSKQLSKMLYPAINECLGVAYDLIEILIKKDFDNYDDYVNLVNQIDDYEKFQKYVLKKLQENRGEING